MRDILLVTFMTVLLPLLIWRPTWGALAWVWWGIMNPHRLAWGFATTIPFAWAIGLATVLGALFSREPKRLKGGAATFVLLVFVAYIIFTTFFALVPDRAWPMLERAVKVQAGTLVALTLLYRKEHVTALVWVMALSIGFYAVKGGLFTIATLGQYRVWGPEDSFIADNNAFALAAVMSIPLWAYLYGQYRARPWFRLGTMSALVLTAISAIGTQSRGAVVAIVAMGLFLWLKSRNKLASGALMVVAALALLAFMPQQWEERVTTIADPRAEASANARIETWTMLWNLAVDRPLTGGGFETYSKWIFQKYNPAYEGTHAAHSIYFQVLGEHGFIALGLFLLFWLLVWRMCSQVARSTKGKPDEQWAYWLAQMIKVSIVAYLVGGAFQNLAYWDMPYYLFVAIAVTRYELRQRAAALAGSTTSVSLPGTPMPDAAAPATTSMRSV
jgi:probable O-glycosylation ligase (exosortase A-associated)